MFSFKLVQEDTINIALLHTGAIKLYGVWLRLVWSSF